MWNDCHRRDTSPLVCVFVYYYAKSSIFVCIKVFTVKVKGCECHACKYYSRAYIHHLLIVKEILGEVLLYQHNQYSLLQLFITARKMSEEGSLLVWLRSLA